MTLGDTLAKYEERGNKAVDEIVYTIDETFKAMAQEQQGFQNTAAIYPVIRSGSFPKKSKEGFDFITSEHTAETTVYYALDLGRTYRLIDTDMLKKLHLDEALFLVIFLNTMCVNKNQPFDYQAQENAVIIFDVKECQLGNFQLAESYSGPLLHQLFEAFVPSSSLLHASNSDLLFPVFGL